MRSAGTRNTLWFLAGLCCGAAAGVLLAPVPGAAYVDRGRELYEKGRELADEAAQMYEDGRHLVEG